MFYPLITTEPDLKIGIPPELTASQLFGQLQTKYYIDLDYQVYYPKIL
jgi:hypothetical protein